MLTTTLLVASVASALPFALWHHERNSRKRIELESHMRVAQALGHCATLRDHETGEHNIRVTYLASRFGEHLGLTLPELRALMKGAFLHDVGKIGIPDAILQKRGPLDVEEWQVLRRHPELGVDLLEDMPWFATAVPIVRHHHERFDGTGYPGALSATAIPLGARIFAVIDVFDALMAERHYKHALPVSQALDFLDASMGSHFDPDLCACFLAVAEDYAENVKDRQEEDLKDMLLDRRKRIFGA